MWEGDGDGELPLVDSHRRERWRWTGERTEHRAARAGLVCLAKGRLRTESNHVLTMTRAAMHKNGELC